MATKKGSSIWLYFTKDDYPNKVKCKICKKCLGSQRTFNLMQHLKHVHKLEIRLSRKRGLQHNDLISERIKPGINETVKASSTFRVLKSLPCENSDPLESIKQEILLDTENSQSSNLLEILPDKSASVKDIEIRAQSNIDKEQVDINPEEGRVIISTYDVSTHDEEIVVPLSNSKVNGWVMLEEPNIVDFEPLLPKAKNRLSMPKGIISADDLDDATSRLKEDSFEQMFKKRKLSLELECLEMHNYKIKLEIWEIEQKLQLQSSKFTKNIARRKKVENSEE